MKTSFLITTASLICLLLPQAHAKVVNLKEVKNETLVIIANESYKLVPDGMAAEDFVKDFAGVGTSSAVELNEREFRSIPAITTSTHCIRDLEIEESKCEVKVRDITLFETKENYLVCTVTSIFRCENEPVGKRLDLDL